MFLTLLASISGGGCRQAEQATPAGWQPVDQQNMTEAQRAQKDQALAARDAMFGELKGRLMEVLGSEGPAAAIRVCAEEAPEIARQVAQQHSVAIGRTSFRLRNPANTPPDWAAPLVERRVEQPYYVAQDGQLGALLPIRLQAECLLCHGPEANIPPPVQEALAQHYPHDQATGFDVDQLRGWFWIEVPGS
jgi:hypothetical protein